MHFKKKLVHVYIAIDLFKLWPADEDDRSLLFMLGLPPLYTLQSVKIFKYQNSLRGAYSEFICVSTMKNIHFGKVPYEYYALAHVCISISLLGATCQSAGMQEHAA